MAPGFIPVGYPAHAFSGHCVLEYACADSGSVAVGIWHLVFPYELQVSPDQPIIHASRNGFRGRGFGTKPSTLNSDETPRLAR